MKISVIIPAYNCASVIEDTINSLFAQTFSNFEVIIVDDGSNDGTINIIDEYAAKYEPIKVFKSKNKGPANARNIGLKHAIGEYVYFMDADDIIHEDMFKDMYLIAKEHSLDAVACGYSMWDISTDIKKEFLYHDFIALSKEDFRAEVTGLIVGHLMNVAWNKLFRTSLIKNNQITFPHFFSGEDRLFNIATMPYIKSFAFINKPYYQYIIRGQNSLASKYLENRFEAVLTCHNNLVSAYDKMEINTKTNYKFLNIIFIKGIISCLVQLSHKSCSLSFRNKMQYINDILDNEKVIEACKFKDKSNMYLKIISFNLKHKNAFVLYIISKLVFLVQSKWNKLYLNIKHGKIK